MFRLLNTQKNARVGLLTINNKSIETPFFMPVATKAAAKHLSVQKLKETGTEAIICNAFLLSLNPGVEIIQKSGSIHNFMNFPGFIFTDSGGFQILDPSFIMHTTDKGAMFKSPFDGKKILLTPEDAIKIQNSLSSDVAMCLDDVPLFKKTKQEIAESVKRTSKWAEQCLQSHKNKNQLIFCITQGSIYSDLRKTSTKHLNSLPFDGIAIGGLCIGENRKDMHKIIELSNNFIDKNKIRYLMGVGSANDIIKAVFQGIDCFDSAFPTRNARHGTLYTSNEKINIKRKAFKNDLNPIDRNCNCETCKNYSRAYISHLMRMNEPLGEQLCTIHSVFYIQSLMKNIRTSIKESSFERDFKKELI